MSNTIIRSVEGYQVLDSRGNPTVACLVTLESGIQARSYVPSGASTGIHEAVELRDNDQTLYGGKGVLKAIHNINTEIHQLLQGKDSTQQAELDRLMIEHDSTENKGRLGANAILAVSMAIARVSAQAHQLELFDYLHQHYLSYEKVEYILPYIGFNVLNGGKHADSGLDVQEYMIMPQHSSFAERIRIGVEIYHSLKDVLVNKGLTTAVGDEGGFAPRCDTNSIALEYIKEASTRKGYTLGNELTIALDVAASEIYDKATGKYLWQKVLVSPEELAKIYNQWIEAYAITSIEDPYDEDDFSSWNHFLQDKDNDITIVGDDLLVTNPQRIQIAIDKQLCNSVLIKPNQIGTVTETFQAISLAHTNRMTTMMSHRSGDTIDTFISDLAVATGCEYMKSGAPARAERVAKYNRLLEIDTILRTL